MFLLMRNGSDHQYVLRDKNIKEFFFFFFVFFYNVLYCYSSYFFKAELTIMFKILI